MKLKLSSWFGKEKQILPFYVLNKVSHDLKNPLACIIGSLEIMERSSNTLAVENKEVLLKTALEEARRLDHYITDMLSLTKLQYDFAVVSPSGTFKKFLLDYALYIILGLALFRLAFTYWLGGDFRAYEMGIGVGGIILIISFIYLQGRAKKTAVSHALSLTHVAHGLAKAMPRDGEKFKSDPKKEAGRGKHTDASHNGISLVQKESELLSTEKVNKATSEFLANMTHELRTPMNAVIGLTHILEKTKLDEQQKQCVDVLKTTSESLMLLINDLLDIDRIEASQEFELECEPFVMTQLLDEVISVIAVRAKQRGVDMVVHYESGLHKTYLGDKGRIRQILLNLMGNAVKFTEKDGIVSILFASFGKKNNKKEITVTVMDTGIGIPDDKLPFIFDKFVQGDNSITRKYGGTGLGLAISQALAKRMGGLITAASCVGKGSVFVLHLPLLMADSCKDAVELPSVESISRQIIRGKGQQPILLVEDYEPNILVATMVLKNFGYPYEIARNGQEALDLFSPHKYSLMLMDVEMPIMDGYETTRRIRSWEKAVKAPPIPILGMTAHALKGHREKCLEVGMNDYLSKPFTPNQLHAFLGKYWKKNSA